MPRKELIDKDPHLKYGRFPKVLRMKMKKANQKPWSPTAFQHIANSLSNTSVAVNIESPTSPNSGGSSPCSSAGEKSD
jgi:hypothetical protein